ncbi:MAG: hypothetical protein IAA31_03385 [Candidatus Anaerobiospirillum merdipullorum]|uniref:Uncharacterized protein n=1 Tax=Candidatus Anaerobiospirillum merdipullorum TaxID=2838450 RepID=A0A9E2KNA5_9GAMM|nr:hypothetical protein [Candidatus Anaerobiospirillum merdipullorum]
MLLPLYVRENTLLAWGNNAKRPDYDYVHDSVFHLFELGDGKSAVATLVDTTGKVVGSLTATRHGQVIDFSKAGLEDLAPCVVLRNIKQATSVDATVSTGEVGVVINAAPATVSFSVTPEA